jgi:hypothetical protein
MLSLRRTWPDDPHRPDDYVIRHDGADAGRVYKTLGTGGVEVWQWTIYGTAKAGREPTLDAAKARWRAAFEQK